MPRKKKNGHASTRETQIRTRLIELSMKVEDLVYHKVPISHTEAETFIKEVNSYKTECYKDERSLQVIEKLTRCMRAIIAEHQEEDQTSYIDDIRENSVSPIYSLPDEDRTQFTQELEIPTIQPVIQTTYVHNNEYRGTMLNQDKKKAIEIISISNEEKDSSNVVNKNIVNFNIGVQETLSNLSNTTSFINNEKMFTTECSQSILNDFKETYNLQQSATLSSINVSKNNNNVELLNQPPVVVNDSNKIVKPIIETPYVKKIAFDENNFNNSLIVKVSKAINNTLNPDELKQPEQIVTAPIVKRRNNNLSINNKKGDIRQQCTTETHTGLIDIHLSGVNQSVINAEHVAQAKLTPNLQNNNTVTEIIDLCNIPDVENNSMVINKNTDLKSNINVDVDMHQALSNLSIKDSVNDETMSIDIDCSQSVLYNFEEKNYTQQRPTTILGGCIPTNNNHDNIQIKAPVVINYPNKIVKPNMVQKQNLNNHNQLVLKVSKAINDNFNPNTQVKYNQTVTTDTLENGNNNKRIRKTINYIQQNNATKYETNLKNKTNVHNAITENTKSIEHVTANKSNVSRNINNKTDPVTAKRKRAPRRNKENSKETAKTESGLKQLNLDDTAQVIKRRPRKTYTRKKKDTSKDSVVPIYNKNTENDLSWLEGIRFVREIGEDEYDKKLSDLNKDFWDNYYLPPNFDESDFL